MTWRFTGTQLGGNFKASVEMWCPPEKDKCGHNAGRRLDVIDPKINEGHVNIFT